MREVNKIASFFVANVPTLKYLGRINVEFPKAIDLKGPNIVVANHTDWSDSFAICKGFREITGDYLYPIMRDDFLGSPDSILNNIIRSAGVILISRDGSRAQKEQQFSSIRDAIIAGDSILVFPARTRSKTGEIFYHVDALSRPISIPKQLDQEISIVAANYTFNPVSRYANVNFGKPITFIPWSKEKGNRAEYFDRFDSQVYDSISSMTTVNMTHLIAAYMDRCRDHVDPVFVFRSNLEDTMKMIYGEIRYTGVRLDNDLLKWKFDPSFDYLVAKSGRQSSWGMLVASSPEAEVIEAKKKDPIGYYAKQVKHVAPLQRSLDKIMGV